MEALKQSVVKLPGDPRALSDARFERHVERVLHLPHPELVRRPQQRQKKSHGGGAKQLVRYQGGVMTIGSDTPCFIPHAVAVRALHAKHIVAVIQIGVRGQALSASHLVPVGLEPLQPIAIAVLLRARVAQGRKFEREDIVAVREGQGVNVRNRLRED